MKPAFLGLGAQKCASTWLHRVLDTHPQVRLPDVKEVDFFSYHFDRGYQWYERHFPALGGEATCTGEVSPSYLHDPSAPRRVREYRSDMRLLVTLRDPVERAISNHKHEVRLGRFRGDDLSFEAGLRNNPMYVEQGRYGRHLANWLRYFPREQMHIVLMEDISARPETVAREVFRFLGLDDRFESAVIRERFNTSYVNRFERLVRLKDRIYQWSRSPGMGWLWSTATGVGARDVYRRLNVVDSDTRIPPPCPATLVELRREFAPDVRELEALLGRSLTHWVCGEGAAQPDAQRTGGAHSLEGAPSTGEARP